jgi:hypothetical protein
MMESSSPAIEPQTTASFPSGKDQPPRRGRSRLSTALIVVAIALLVASVVTQALLIFVVIPQQIRDSEPVVIDQAALFNEGPYVGCFQFLSYSGGVFHQGESFSLAWNIVAPTNISGSCTIQSIDEVLGPVHVTGSDLPVTIRAGQTEGVLVSFAPIDEPYWGGITIGVMVTTP